MPVRQPFGICVHLEHIKEMEGLFCHSHEVRDLTPYLVCAEASLRQPRQPLSNPLYYSGAYLVDGRWIADLLKCYQNPRW